MSCACDDKHLPSCQFSDSGILGGKFWPRRKRCPFSSIMAGAVIPFHSLSDVAQTLVLTVREGSMGVWLQDDRPTVTDPTDFEVGASPNPFDLRLAAGQQSIWIGAIDSVDLAFRAVLVDAEERR